MKKIIVSLLIGMLLGFGVGYYFLPQHQVITTEKKKIDSIIDSVAAKRVEVIKEKVIWKDRIITIEKEKEIEKEKVQELPLDSGILWLSIKLKEYEKN